jgi:hypothetical protein
MTQRPMQHTTNFTTILTAPQPTELAFHSTFNFIVFRYMQKSLPQFLMRRSMNQEDNDNFL